MNITLEMFLSKRACKRRGEMFVTCWYRGKEFFSISSFVCFRLLTSDGELNIIIVGLSILFFRIALLMIPFHIFNAGSLPIYENTNPVLTDFGDTLLLVKRFIRQEHIFC